MKTVKIYRVECTTGVMIGEEGWGFSLEPWGNDTAMIQGDDDGGVNYDMPDGLHVGQSKSHSKEFFAESGEHCPLTTIDDLPVVIVGSREIILQIAK